MCFGDTRDVRIDIEEGTQTGLAAVVVDAPRVGGRYYGLGDSAAGNLSNGPAPFLQVALVQPFPSGWRITRMTAKASGSDAAFEGRIRLRGTLDVGVPPLNNEFDYCDVSGPSGSSYDVCDVDMDYELTENQLLALHARSILPASAQQSNLTRVSACITIEPPEDDVFPEDQ